MSYFLRLTPYFICDEMQEFKWRSGEDWSYSNWGEGEPGESTMMMMFRIYVLAECFLQDIFDIISQMLITMTMTTTVAIVLTCIGTAM